PVRRTHLHNPLFHLLGRLCGLRLRLPRSIRQTTTSLPLITLPPLVARLPRNPEPPAQLRHLGLLVRRQPHKLFPQRHPVTLTPWHAWPPWTSHAIRKVLPMSPNKRHLCLRSIHKGRGEEDVGAGHIDSLITRLFNSPASPATRHSPLATRTPHLELRTSHILRSSAIFSVSDSSPTLH